MVIDRDNLEGARLEEEEKFEESWKVSGRSESHQLRTPEIPAADPVARSRDSSPLRKKVYP